MKILCWMILVVNSLTHLSSTALTKTRLSLSASFLFLFLFLVACAPAKTERDSYKFSGNTMGTQYNITVVAEKGKSLTIDKDQLQKEIDTELKSINQIMSTYIPDSELMQFNRSPLNEVQEISEPLMVVFGMGKMVSDRSNGAFDVTVGPLVDLWGFGPTMGSNQIPTESDVQAAARNVGYQHLKLNHEGATRLRDVKADLSAIAKGYGVDSLLALLMKKGLHNAMVEIGGEVRVKGISVRGTPWRIAIEQPQLQQGDVRLVVELDDLAIATSGDYRNYFEVDGKQFSHTIDPITGRPVTHELVSVSVVTNMAIFADAWATAINVLGPIKGLEVAEKENLAVYMIVKTEDGYADIQSESFRQLVHQEEK